MNKKLWHVLLKAKIIFNMVTVNTHHYTSPKPKCWCLAETLLPENLQQRVKHLKHLVFWPVPVRRLLCVSVSSWHFGVYRILECYGFSSSFSLLLTCFTWLSHVSYTHRFWMLGFWGISLTAFLFSKINK